MKRSIIVGLSVLILVGCSVKIKNQYTFPDTVDTTGDTVNLEVTDAVGDGGGKEVVEPLTCDQAWACVYPSCDVMVEDFDNSSCVKACYSALEGKQLTRVQELHDCAKTKCSDKIKGSEQTACIYRYCIDKWAVCVNPTPSTQGASCGSMYSEILDCGALSDSEKMVSCISKSLVEGTKGGLDNLKKVVPCGPNAFDWQLGAKECVESLVYCLVGGGTDNCSTVANCQFKCFKDKCPAKLKHDFGEECSTKETSDCLVGCLSQLGTESLLLMKNIEVCLFEKSHKEFIKGPGAGGGNPYSDCLSPAVSCFDGGGSFYTCSSVLDCASEFYDFFTGDAPGSLVPMLPCIQDLKDADVDAVVLALSVIATAYDAWVSGAADPIPGAKGSCN